ncbi:hypothetical protein [Thiomicrorhabdus aquaedulcis]|uniref:hypothetical protein n=1 Tax=Thiomicrorhabdus aquaedulcis TaxID=2211106 RepID=UPI001E2954C9|nr:hypothetical protein [Thiomicrorhabdus aquaedulcis]
MPSSKLPLGTPFRRLKARLDNLLIDHEILRMAYRNFYELSQTVFRSNHPSAAFLAKLQKNMV